MCDSQQKIKKVRDSLFSKGSPWANKAVIQRKVVEFAYFIVPALVVAGLILAVNAAAARMPKIGLMPDVSGIGVTFDNSQRAARDLFIKNRNPNESGHPQPASCDFSFVSGGRHDQPSH